MLSIIGVYDGRAMQHHADGQSVPENVTQLLIMATALSHDLERELVQLELGNRCGSQLKQVYDTVYLPVAVALAEGLYTFAVDDSAVLGQSLCVEAPLANVQLR